MKRLVSSILLGATLLVSTSANAEPSSTLHKVSGGVFLTGSLIVIAAVAIPLGLCNSHTETDSMGYTRKVSSCDDVPDRTKAAWVAGGGIGLTLAVLGGIVYFETEPKQPTLALTPWMTTASGGATFVARF